MSKDTVAAMDDTSEEFSPKEIQDLSQAVSSLKPELEEEREVLREIKEDREEYREVSTIWRSVVILSEER